MNFCRIVFAMCFVFAVSSFSQTGNNLSNQESQTYSTQIPLLKKQGTATQLIVGGKPFLLLSGELHNSTCGGFDYMRPVWKRLAKKNLNSVIATVSWELVEPEEGQFNFILVDSIIAGAREENLKLVLIWFASWKNASSVYIPSWVKKNYGKYPRAKDELGKSLEILSTLGDASCEADAKAFAALMRHIKEVDSKQQTVVMMQVENEVGVLDNLGRDPWGKEVSENPGNARRDFCDQANTAYNGPVPKELLNYLMEHKESLFPELHKVWKANGFKTTGSWEEIFGKSEFRREMKDWKFYSYYTEELFSAWNYARYVEKVTAAGKKEYPIPMYVNAWLKQPFSYWPGRYPSGGPLPQVLDIWRAAAPSIDFMAPDIYMDDFNWACQEYTRSGNPLFIPETRGGDIGAARAFYVFGEHNAGCFSPFGIDDTRNVENDPLDKAYAVLQNMSSIILEHQGMGTMRGILVDTLLPIQQFELGDYKIEAKLGGRENTDIAGGLIINVGPQEYIVAGRALDVFFNPKDDLPAGQVGSLRVAVNAVDELTFKDGKLVSERRLNGDEVHASTSSGTGVKLPSNQISIQKISLYRYK